jgi:hypothetical protein
MNVPRPVRVVAQELHGRFDDPNRCEDAVVIADNGIYAILDGAGSHPAVQQQLSTGRVAMQAATQAIHLLPADADAESAATVISVAVREACAVNVHSWIRPPAVQLVAYHAGRDEVWQIGDCWWAFGGELHTNFQPFDRLCAELRSLLLHARVADGHPWPDTWFFDDPIVGMVDQLVQAQAVTTNHVSGGPWSNGWLSIENTPRNRVLVTPLSGRSGRLLLASDGYPPAASPSECEQLRRAATAGGPVRGLQVDPPWRSGALAADDRALLLVEL